MRQSFTIIAFTLLFQIVTAQTETPAKKRSLSNILNVEQGLLNNATNDVITDKLGFTWISTRTGMQRYNGYRLETITPVAGKDTFYINYPVYFFQLKNGSIWISLKDGILMYDPGSNAFKSLASFKVQTGMQFSIVPLKETKQGIWCIQQGKGIVLYNTDGKLIKEYTFFEPTTTDRILNSPDLLFYNTIAESDSCIYINNPADKNVLAINTATAHARSFQFNSKIFSIAFGSDNLFLLFSDTLASADAVSARILKQVKLPETGQPMLVGTLKYSIDRRLFAGFNNRFYEVDPYKLTFQEVTDIRKNSLLSTGFVQKIYRDDLKRIWILTNNDVRRIQDRDISFDHLFYPQAKNNFVKALYYDEQSRMLISGCFNGGLQVYDSLSNPLWEEPLITPETKDVLCIEKLERDKYLIVTYEKGWYLLNTSDHSIHSFTIPPLLNETLHPLQVNFANNVQRINDSTILIATANNIFKCIFSGIRLLSASPLIPINQISTINCLLYTSEKKLWTGTSTGTIYLVDNNKKFTEIIIPGKYAIRSIAEDGKRNIWIGTDKGVFVYTSDGNFKKRISMESGLLNDCIYSILPVNNDAAVFSGTNLGLSYISLNGTIKNFSKEMGLQENEFNTGSAYRSASGKFFFGGINGITAFYPSSLSGFKDAPLLHITRLVVNDSLYNSSAGIWKGDTINLSYDKNRIRFDLSAMGLLNTNEYVYKYRMIGFEKEWQSTIQPLGINYTLEPGNYTLEVTFYPALSTEDVFQKKFYIIIHPPWWQKWWVRTIAILLLIGAIVFIVQQYNRRKYRRRILTLQMQQHVQEEKERISRELHDDLGTRVNMLSYNASLLDEANSAEEIKKVKERIKATSSDMLLSLRETVWTLKQENITSEDVWTRFKNFISKLQSTYLHIKFVIDEQEGLDKKLNYNTALNLIRILQESVNNAIKHSGCTHIACIKKIAGENVIFNISDNGKGFNISEIEVGNGLENMEQRSKESGLELSFQSEAGRGTSVIVTL